MRIPPIFKIHYLGNYSRYRAEILYIYYKHLWAHMVIFSAKSEGVGWMTLVDMTWNDPHIVNRDAHV